MNSNAEFAKCHGQGWQEKHIGLKCRLGEFTIAKLDFLLLVCDTDYRTQENSTPPPAPPVAAIKAAGSQGFMYRSYRLEQPPKPLSMKDGVLRYITGTYSRQGLALDGDFESYLASFKSKSRSSLKRKVKKLESVSNGGLSFKAYFKPGDVEEFLEKAWAVSALTYQAKLLNSGLPEGRAFAEGLKQKAENNVMRGYILSMGEKPISYLYCPLDGQGVLTYDYLGYDPAYAKYSPGTVLHYYAIEAMFADPGAEYLDFTEGEGQHKSTFGRESYDCADIMFIRATIINTARLGFHYFLKLASAGIVRIVDRIGLKARIKKMIRTRSLGR